MNTKGFTLIELLVVIAIIALLSLIVLGSLNSARSKGGDSSVKSQMAALRAQAELFYDANKNSYNNGTQHVCSTGVALTGNVKAIGNMLLAAASITGSLSAGIASASTVAGTSGTVTCHSNANAWAAEAPLKSNTSNMWCVDSAGNSKSTGVNYLPASATVCP